MDLSKLINRFVRRNTSEIKELRSERSSHPNSLVEALDSLLVRFENPHPIFQRKIKRLCTEWEFLRTFYYLIDDFTSYWNVWTSFRIRIPIAAKEIESGLSSALKGDKWWEFMDDYEKKTKILKAEVGKTFGYVNFNIIIPEYTGESYLSFVLLNLQSIIDDTNEEDHSQLGKQVRTLYKELELIEQEQIIGNFSRAFFNHVESEVLHIAFQSCHYWFNINPTEANSKLNLLVDLHHEIDPSSNPKFFELNLEFLEAFRKFYPNIDHHLHIHDDFFRSLLTWKGGDYRYDLRKQIIKFLADIVIDDKLDHSCEDVVMYFAEINAALMETASLSCQGNETRPRSLAELATSICVLDLEHFLKIQLDSHIIHEDRVTEKLNQRRTFSEDLPPEKTEYGKKALALINAVDDGVASIRFQGKSAVKKSLLQLLLRIVIFKAESFLMELLDSNASGMAYENVEVESLLDHLKIFNVVLMIQIKEDSEEVKIIFPLIEAFARRITLLSYSFLPREITQDIQKITFSFSELSDQVLHIKAKLKAISLKFQVPAFRKTFGLLSLDLLVRKLGELLKHSSELIAPVMNHIEEIQLHLKAFLMKVSDLDVENPGLKELGNNIIDAAYKVDYVINLIDFDVHWQSFFWIYDLLEELRLVDKQVSNIHVKTADGRVQNVSNVIKVSQTMILQYSSPAIDEEMVNLRDQEGIIIDQLIGGFPPRDIVSIVGMPGIGKTTLARIVYHSQQIRYHFHCLAWCTVSQIYEKRELLLEIISDIHGLTDEIRQKSNADLELKLRQCLLRNRYLIVMDDVWDIGAWDDLKNSFPDDSNGSRILLTSRLLSVASKIRPGSDPHSLRPFSEEESWKLLEKKVFKSDGCPSDFLIVGKQIAVHCKGLPLAVVAIAGLLTRTEKRQDWWEKIAKSLSSQIFNDPEDQCMKILELSYKHLPVYLRSCFLYLIAFLEDKDIPVSKLIRFWLAEGFIEKTDSRSLEDIAEDYLMDLINRSLVMISKRKSNGRVKGCRLHDLVRDFCQSKAKEENFMQLVTRRDEPYASLPNSDYGFEFDFDHHFDSVTFEAHRLSILLRRNHFVDSKPSGLGTRSLIFFASSDSEPRCPYDISSICQNFKCLWVLDLESINMGVSFPDEIGLLIRLRYLAVSGFVRKVPKSIAKLRELETFVVKGLRGTVVLPNTIWHMTSLRHLHVNKHVTFNLQGEDVGSSFQLDNLISFSCPSFSYGEDAEKILKRLPNLCKLGCIFLESWDSSKNFNQFPRLNFLTHLDSLKIFYYGRALNPGEFCLPLNLKELTLSNFHLPWDCISAIGKLPNLEILKLVSGAFEGLIWNMREEEFQELKFLKLDTLNIAQWNASCDHLPKLQRLVLQNCKTLQNVPYDFADITSLKTIEVLWCGESADKSAREIGDATGEIKVLITSS